MIKLSKIWFQQDTVTLIEFDQPSQNKCLITVVTLDSGRSFTLTNEDPGYLSDISILKSMW